jgi:hypothetical protein
MLLNVKKCCFAPAASRLNKKTARWRLGAIVPGEHPYRRVGGEERASAQPRGRSAASLGWPRERVSCVNSPGMSGTLPSAWVRTPGRGLRDIFRTGRWRDDLRPWHYVPVLARKPGALRNGAPFKDWVLPIRPDNRSYLRELNGRMF